MQSTSAAKTNAAALPVREKLALARQLARDDPKMVANVVKQWVAGHE